MYCVLIIISPLIYIYRSTSTIAEFRMIEKLINLMVSTVYMYTSFLPSVYERERHIYMYIAIYVCVYVFE